MPEDVAIAITPPRPVPTLDVLVTRTGKLQCAPWLAIGVRTVPFGTTTRHHPTGVAMVRLMIAGQLAFTDDRGTCIVDSEDIVTAGFEPHLTSAISDEPARFLEIWVRAAVAARTVVRHARVERVERPTEVVATGGGSIRSVVLPVGAMLRHRNRTPSYVLSTVGRICVDGLIAGPAARVQLIGDGDVAITALESTEVVILHEPHCDPSFASRTAARASSSTSEQAARSRLGVFVDFA